MSRLRQIGYFELDGDAFPSLRDHIHSDPQEYEEEIACYLERAPNYCAVGKIVGDVLQPNQRAVLFPGRNTDGIFIWASELSYYVRKYHLRLPICFVERMAQNSWSPPPEENLDWEALFSETVVYEPVRM